MGVGGVRTRRRYIAYAAGPCRGLPWVDFFVHNNTCPTRGLPRIIGTTGATSAGAVEVARAVIYLVSSDGDYITGEELSMNGGLLMR